MLIKTIDIMNDLSKQKEFYKQYYAFHKQNLLHNRKYEFENNENEYREQVRLKHQ